jgi:dephospho-CoA kinase
MQIIGITGTNGAGKGTVVDILKDKFEYTHFSVREFLTRELRKRDLEINRANMRKLANELREQYGPGYIVKELYREALQFGKPCIIESIRCIGEIDALEEIARETQSNFLMLGVDADPEIRYERSVKRKSELDDVSLEEFKELEEAEMRSTDPGKQNLGKCIQRCEKIFNNNGTMDELKESVIEFMIEGNIETSQVN